jgi:hypothetical protein
MPSPGWWISAPCSVVVKAVWRERAVETTESVLVSADMSPDDLARAVRDNEALGDLLAMAIDIGSRTRNEQKRRALGSMVGRVLLHPDSARVDETELLLKAIEPLEAVHIRVLVHIWSEMRKRAGGVRRDGVSDRTLNKVVPSPAALSSVLTTLTGVSLIYSITPELDGGGPPTDVGPLTEVLYVSPFGDLMLKWLTLEEGKPLRVDD